MKTDFIPLDYDYFDFKGRNFIKIYGRNSDEKRICLIDDCDIFFWAILKQDISKKQTEELIKKTEKIKLNIKGRQTKVEKVELKEKNFLGKPVKALKIYATNYKDLHDIADKLDDKKIVKRRGYDLGFITHYIIEKRISPLNWYEIEGEMLNNSDEFGGIDNSLEVDFCIRLNSLKILEKKEKSELFNPRILAYDIETEEFEIGKGEIYMISLVGNNFKKVLTCKDSSKKAFVQKFKNEKEMLEAFVEEVKKYSPDILTGYFSDGFDLPYIKSRADKNKVKLNLGLDGSSPKFSVGVMPTAKIKGIVHVDLLRFISTAYSQYMSSETLSLNEVASELLGEKKKEYDLYEHIKNKKENWEEFYEYNLQDSVLTYNLFEKVWPDMLEFTKVMQEPLFNVSRNGMSSNVEDYIIHHLERFNEIPEKRPTYDEIGERKSRQKYEGAFVFQPTPGLYKDICIFDFTSMHASIIVSYNLSKATLLDKKEKGCTESPEFELNGEKRRFYFSKEKSFFPELLGEIVNLRKKYKNELKEKPDVIKKARSNAFKLLANAYYGYMGFFGARYYSVESAATTLAFVRHYNKWTIDQVNQKGYKVIFGDTDSVGFTLNKKSKKETQQFLKKLNSELPGIMELDLEGFFEKGIWVTKRTGDFGAKKKYALIDEKGKIKIRGFETVRRDWCKLAREVQSKVIELVLREGNEKKALEYLKEIIKKIKSRKIDQKEIIIRTQLKKSISEYKSISPHVIAAKKMHEQDIPVSQGNLIEYYISEPEPGKTKSKLVREKVKLPHEPGEYSIEYYLERQIIPAVENIFQVFCIDVKALISQKNQTSLSDF